MILVPLVALAQALKTPFEIEGKSYKPEFADKILESRKQFEEGNFEMIAIEYLWK